MATNLVTGEILDLEPIFQLSNPLSVPPIFVG